MVAHPGPPPIRTCPSKASGLIIEGTVLSCWLVMPPAPSAIANQTCHAQDKECETTGLRDRSGDFPDRPGRAIACIGCIELGAYLNFQGRQEESLANLEAARKILIALVRDHPDVVNYRVDLELTNYHIGCRYRFFGRYIQALSTLEQARDFFEKMDQENPNEPNSRQLLAAIWEDIAGMFRATHRDPDAVTAYQQAILHQTRAYQQAISDSRSRGESANHLLSQYEKLAETHLLLNRPTDAADSLSRAIASLKKRPFITPNESYVEARIVCRMIDVLDRDGQKPTAARQVQRGVFVKQAVRALRSGFPPGTVSFKGLKDDKHLDSIRCDVEFQVFMMDLAFPAKPFERSSGPTPTLSRPRQCAPRQQTAHV